MRTPLLSAIATLGLLALTGPGCSDDKGGGQMNAALCQQLNAKQNELDCKVAALGESCASADTACNNKKASDLAICNNITTANWTSSRTDAGLCGVPGAASASASSSSTATATVTSSGVVSTVLQ